MMQLRIKLLYVIAKYDIRVYFIFTGKFSAMTQKLCYAVHEDVKIE